MLCHGESAARSISSLQCECFPTGGGVLVVGFVLFLFSLVEGVILFHHDTQIGT